VTRRTLLTRHRLSPGQTLRLGADAILTVSRLVPGAVELSIRSRELVVSGDQFQPGDRVMIAKGWHPAWTARGRVGRVVGAEAWVDVDDFPEGLSPAEVPPATNAPADLGPGHWLAVPVKDLKPAL
jgi:hypothetical protein